MNKLKFLTAILMGAVIACSSAAVQNQKDEAVAELYDDVIFTHLCVQAKQSVREIENGLKNGKMLDNFYGMNAVLNSVRRCSSYIAEVYVVSADCRVLYFDQDGGQSKITRINVGFSERKMYSVYDDDARDSYVLSVRINGEEKTDGYMILDISRDAVKGAARALQTESRIRLAVLSAQMFLLGTILLIRAARKPKRFYRYGCGIVAGVVCCNILLDGLICVYRFRERIESVIGQSASVISMSLQNDLDAVRDKGVPPEKIFDLDGVLTESTAEIPFIQNLILDRNFRITAVVSQEYVTEQTLAYALVFLRSAAGFALIGLLIPPLVITIRKLKKRRERAA